MRVFLRPLELAVAIGNPLGELSGTVTAKNEDLDTAAELVNTDPYGKGWMIKVKFDDPSELDALLDAEAYKKMIGA